MKKRYALSLSLLLVALLTACNAKPEKGEQGIQGEQGEKGDKGDTGEAGKDGSKIYTGEGVPNDNTGVEGDLYIDTTTWNLYTKGSDKWSLTGNIKGDPGSSGVSVTNTYIDENGNLICELSDGQTVNAGKVKDTTKHTVNFHFKDSIIETKEVVSGSKITPPDSSLIPEGYTVTGWYINEYGMKSPWTFNGCVVTCNLDLYASHELINYSITYNLDGGSIYNKIESYTVEDTFALDSPTKDGYQFVGWTGSNGDSPETNYTLPKGSTGDKTFTANWSGKKQTLNVTSNDETLGTVSIVSGSGYTGESINVKATPTSDNFFIGWYSNNTYVSSNATYTFTMPSNAYSLTAKFVNKIKAEALGMVPNITANTLTYVLYPQSYVSDATLTAELDKLTTTDINGWYLYEDSYYAKMNANSYDSCYVFDDGTLIKSETYWFKCEPITWKILKTSNNEYTLLSNVLLDAHRYGEHYTGTKSKTDYNGETATVYASNYKYSEIRTWLNVDFYNTAFALNNFYIQTTLVDNSASTTCAPDENAYACENTNDKVYLLSYQDYLKTSYGFTNSVDATTTRECVTSEYARANGALCRTNNYGYYWTRSPYFDNTYAASIICNDGKLSSGYTLNSEYRTVRPSITLKAN